MSKAAYFSPILEMNEFVLRYDASSMQVIVSRKIFFPSVAESILISAENATMLQAAALEQVRLINNGYLPDGDCLIFCPQEIADRAVFLVQKEAELSAELDRLDDDPYLKQLGRQAAKQKGRPDIAEFNAQIMYMSQFDAIVVIEERCYPVYAAGVDSPENPDCDFVSCVWHVPPGWNMRVPDVEFWEMYREPMSETSDVWSVVSFPLHELDRARLPILERRAQKNGSIPGLQDVLHLAQQHHCPTPLRCHCYFFGVCAGCHNSKGYHLEDLQQCAEAGGLCWSCQRNTLAGQRALALQQQKREGSLGPGLQGEDEQDHPF